MVFCTCKRGLLAALLLILVVSGIALLLCHGRIFQYIYNTQLVLSPTSGSFPMWSVLPSPMIASMYLFHVLNPDEVSAGAKPRLEERGPYVFTEHREKRDLTWNGTDSIKFGNPIQKCPQKLKEKLSDPLGKPPPPF